MSADTRIAATGAARAAPVVLPQRAVQVLALGCLLGLAAAGAYATANALGERTAWSEPGSTATREVLGAPLMGAAEVATARRLIERTLDADERVIVLFPSVVEPFVIEYARYQLLHLLYPRQVEVRDAGSVGSLDAFDALVTAPGLRGPGDPAATDGGFAVYRREAR